MMTTDTRTILVRLMTIQAPADVVSTETVIRRQLRGVTTILPRVDRVTWVPIRTTSRRRHTGENTATPTLLTRIDGKNHLQLARCGSHFVLYMSNVLIRYWFVVAWCYCNFLRWILNTVYIMF